MAITISGANNVDKILATDGVLDSISGFNVVGVMTAGTFDVTGKTTTGHLNIGSNIQIGNAGIITATTLIGNVTGNINATSNLLLQIGGSEKFRVASSGQLGIGGANYGSSGQVLTSGGSGAAASWSTIASDKITEGNTEAEVVDTGSDGHFKVTTEGSERLRILSTGQVLLGATSGGNADTDDLVVSGSGKRGITICSTNGSECRLTFADGLSGVNAVAGNITYDHSVDRMDLYTNTARRVSILSNGKVGVNTTGPSQQFTSYAASGYPVLANGPSNGIGLGGNGVIVFGNKDLASYGSGAIDASDFAIKTSGTEKLRIDSSGRLLHKHTASRNVGTKTGQLQVINTGNDATISIIQTNNAASAPFLAFGKTRSGNTTGSTIVQNNDSLGQILFAGADGTDVDSIGAWILAQVDGTPGSNDMPGRLIFSTTADGSSTPTERFRLDSNGNARFGPGGTIGNYTNYTTLVIANTAGGDIEFRDSGNNNLAGDLIGAEGSGMYLSTKQDTPIIFRTGASSTEKLRIDSNGRSLFSGTLGYGNMPFGGNPANAAIQIRCNSKYNGIAFGENAVSGCIGLGGADTTTAMVFTANANPANLGGGTKDIFEWWSGNAGGGGPGKYMTLDTSGHLALTSGNLEFANGNGIDFSAVPDGGRSISTDGNKLDDYEEGTYVPTTNTGLSLQSAYDVFSYIKVGRMCTVRGLWYPNNNPSGSHIMSMSLPFASYNYNQIAGAGGSDVMHRLISGASNGVAVYVEDNNTIARFYKNGGSGNWSNVLNSDWNTAMEIYVDFTYFTV